MPKRKDGKTPKQRSEASKKGWRARKKMMEARKESKT